MLKNAHIGRNGNLDQAGVKVAPDGWRPPGGYADCNLWALENRAGLEQYAQRTEKDGTAAEQLERFLAEHPETLNSGHAAV